MDRKNILGSDKHLEDFQCKRKMSLKYFEIFALKYLIVFLKNYL